MSDDTQACDANATQLHRTPQRDPASQARNAKMVDFLSPRYRTRLVAHLPFGVRSSLFVASSAVFLLQNGFFASAGPLDIFVSQYGLPADLKFDTSGSSGTPMLHSVEEDVRIEIGTEVRIKLIGIRMATDQIAVLGTIKEDFLG